MSGISVVVAAAAKSVQASAGGFEAPMLAAFAVVVGGIVAMLGILLFYQVGDKPRNA